MGYSVMFQSTYVLWNDQIRILSRSIVSNTYPLIVVKIFRILSPKLH